jgi:hypothetical protein
MPWSWHIQVAVGIDALFVREKTQRTGTFNKSPLNTTKGLRTPNEVHGLQVDFH